MSTVRAKFVCVEKSPILSSAWEITQEMLTKYEGRHSREDWAAAIRVVLKPVYNDGSTENARFANATSPDGECRMMLMNKEAAATFELGKAYYLDFTPTEAP